MGLTLPIHGAGRVAFCQVVANSAIYTLKMRRKSGDALVKNEERVLAAALALLNDGEPQFHGYRLVKAFETNPKLTVAMSTLYRCLGRLEDRGLLAGKWRAPDDDRDARPSRFFHLTPDGVQRARDLDFTLVMTGNSVRLISN